MKDPIFVIQDCQKEDTFDKADFIVSINQMSQEQFDHFCRKVKYLTHYHDSTYGASVSDDAEFVEANPDKFWKLSDT